MDIWEVLVGSGGVLALATVVFYLGWLLSRLSTKAEGVKDYGEELLCLTVEVTKLSGQVTGVETAINGPLKAKFDSTEKKLEITNRTSLQAIDKARSVFEEILKRGGLCIEHGLKIGQVEIALKDVCSSMKRIELRIDRCLDCEIKGESE